MATDNFTSTEDAAAAFERWNADDYDDHSDHDCDLAAEAQAEEPPDEDLEEPGIPAHLVYDPAEEAY